MKCIYCKNKTYLLKNGYRKCKVCKRKFSPLKVKKELSLIKCFCEDLNALKCSEKLNLNYITVKKRYDHFRKLIALFLEKEYEKKKEVLEFDEYLYLQKSKRRDKKNIFDAYNFLTFDYGGKVYNLLMPDLSRFKPSFLEDGLDELYYQEFQRFLKIHRVAKLTSHKNQITKFWEFFEEFILKYKGINRDNFFYYLKEAEFKFNYSKQKQKEILQSLIFSSKI
ncbi:MAG: transposase [Epsilonproteobacteria bacterium]|nr:transposase [Campylobacterota bacterium]